MHSIGMAIAQYMLDKTYYLNLNLTSSVRGAAMSNRESGTVGRFIKMISLCAILLHASGGVARGDDPSATVENRESAVADESAVELPAVQVTGKKEEAKDGSAESGYRYDDASVGPLGDVPLRDAPYSINVTSGEMIRNRAAHTEYEALKTNPAVSSLMETSGYSSLSRIMIRGFTAADQSDLRDGLVDRSFTFVPLDNVERVEVLNGLSSFLYGFSSLGGSVNYVTKQPPSQLAISADTGVYDGGVFYGRGEVGGPLPFTDGKLSMLLTASKEGGDAYLEDSTHERDFVSAVVKYQLTRNTVLTADFWNQYFAVDGLQSYININTSKGIGVPSASSFDAGTQYGQSWTYNHSRKTLGGASLESKLTDVFTFRTAFRYGDMWRDYKYVSATLTDSLGNYTETTTSTPRQTEITRSGCALMDADFTTFGIGHKATFGYSGTNFTYTRGDDITTTLGSSSIYSTVDYDDPELSIGSTNVWYEQFYNSWLAGDRIEFSDAWSALVGVNYASLKLRRWGSGSALSAGNYSQHRLTPSCALMFKPIPNITTYASYIEGLANGGSAPSTYNGKAVANAGEMLGPSVSRQYEVGSKATFGRMDLAAALFYIDKVNEYTDPSDLVYKQDGREVHKGVEFTATGKLSEDLNVVGGVTFLDASVEKSNDSSIEGKTPVNVPEQQARLYLEYILPFAREFTASAGVFYNGKRPVDSKNVYYMDDSTTFDAGLRYRTTLGGHALSVNLYVKNVFDTDYWSYYRSGDGLFLGEPRTITLALRADW